MQISLGMRKSLENRVAIWISMPHAIELSAQVLPCRKSRDTETLTLPKYAHCRVKWFFYFENETQKVVRNYLRTPNPNYDPLKLRFSICGNPLKVWLFSSFILSIWISHRQWLQRRRRRSALAAETVRAPPTPPSLAQEPGLGAQPWGPAWGPSLGAQPGGPAWGQSLEEMEPCSLVWGRPHHFFGWLGRAESARAPCRLVPPLPTGQIQSRPLKPSFYCEN